MKLLITLLFLFFNTLYSQGVWVQQTSGITSDVKGFYFFDSFNGWAVGNYGKILKTTNGGINWDLQPSLPSEILKKICFTTENIGWIVGGWDGELFRSTNGGSNWEIVPLGISYNFKDIFFTDINHGWIVGSGVVLRTTDGGINWNEQTFDPNNDFTSVYFFNSTNGIIVGSFFNGSSTIGIALRTTNGGADWTQTYTGNKALTDVYFPTSSIGTAVGLSGTVVKTTTGGLSWSHQPSGIAYTLDGVCFTDVNNGWIVGGGGIIRTTNGGISWNPEQSGTNFELNCVDFVDLFNGWIGGDNGTILKYEASKTPVIFIPGIMGSTLYDNVDPNDQHLTENERIWIDISKFRSDLSNTFLDALQLANNGFDPLNSSYNIEVAPLRNDTQNGVKHNLAYQLQNVYPRGKPFSIYKSFFEGLISGGNYILDDGDDNTQLGENLFCFVYDWRKSITYNAGKLSDFIDFVLSSTGSSRVNLIAHSMGGLVAKQCIKEYSWGRIKKLIFTGTPHLGSPKIYSTLLSGNLHLGGFLDGAYNSEKILKMSLNMPSGYQLFPTQKYFDVSLNNGVSTRVDLYNYGFWSLQGNPLNYLLTQQYFKSVDLLNGWRFNDLLLDQAQTYQTNSLEVDYGDIDLYNIVTWGIPTIGEVRDFMLGLEHRPDPEYSLWGDGTVPLRSAEIVSMSKKKADYYFANIEHSALPSNPQVISVILDLLKEPAVTNFNNPPNTYAVNPLYQITAGSPVELHVYDSQNRHTGSITDSTWENNIPDSWYFANNLQDTISSKVITVPKGDNFTIKLLSLNALSNFDLSIKDIIEGQNRIEVKYINVPIFPNSISRCEFDTLTENLELKLDFDGDGNIDSILSPSYFLTDIENEGNAEGLISYLLKQNFPNPFNHSTTIEYDILTEGVVKLELYDILGRKIATLINESQRAGRHSINFDASNLFSGVYIYKLQAGSFVDSKKMILLK